VDVLDPARAQGLVPLIMKVSGGTYRSWFAALYLPGALQWPAIAVISSPDSAMLAWPYAERPRSSERVPRAPLRRRAAGRAGHRMIEYAIRDCAAEAVKAQVR